MAMEKEYSGVLRLGQSTPSFDAETPPDVETPWRHLTDLQLTAAAATFVGNIQQLPPMFSAVKIKGGAFTSTSTQIIAKESFPNPDLTPHLRQIVWLSTQNPRGRSGGAHWEGAWEGAGKPLYLAARAGLEVSRQPRSCCVTRFHVRRCQEGSRDVAFSITCSKGTYIRSLAHDLVWWPANRSTDA